MKIVRVTTTEMRNVEYHVDEKLRRRGTLNEAGLKVARIIELSGILPRDYQYINTKSFTIGTQEAQANEAKFRKLVSEYGHVTPSLQFSWSKTRSFAVVEVTTNVAFSHSDTNHITYPRRPVEILTINRIIPSPIKRIRIECQMDSDQGVVEKFLRTALLG